MRCGVRDTPASRGGQQPRPDRTQTGIVSAHRQPDHLRDGGLASFLKMYTGSAPVVTVEERSSIREDVALREVVRILSIVRPRIVRVLDLCCGEASLAMRIGRSIPVAEARRVTYVGVDHNPSCVAAVEARASALAGLRRIRMLQ